MRAKNASLLLTGITENEKSSKDIKTVAKLLMKIKGFSSQNELDEFLELTDISYTDSDSIRFYNPSINEVDSPALLDLDEE